MLSYNFKQASSSITRKGPSQQENKVWNPGCEAQSYALTRALRGNKQIPEGNWGEKVIITGKVYKKDMEEVKLSNHSCFTNKRHHYYWTKDISILFHFTAQGINARLIKVHQ